METIEKVLYYSSLSKFKLVEMLQERGQGKYAYTRTKPEIIKTLCEMDTNKKCKCCQDTKNKHLT